MSDLGRIVKQHLKPKDAQMPTTTEMKCQICGESFKNRYSLASHVRWNHKQKASLTKQRASNRRPYAKWTPEQYQLARSIIASPQWRGSDGDVDWARVFSVHPEWGQSLNYSKDNPRFTSFIARVKQGAGKRAAPVAPAVNGNGSSHVQIGGREYDLLELEQIIKAHQNALAPLKFCPECGTNLLMHTKAYSIAKRHTQEG